MTHEGDNRPYDPAGTRPKVDPESLRSLEPPPDLPWAEREARAEDQLEDAIERLEELHDDEDKNGIPDASEHMGRFQFVLGGLIAVGLLAVAVIVLVIAVGPSDQASDDWSAWRPSGDDPLQQIADHVGADYRLENGDQIVSVTGGPLKVGTDVQVTPQLVLQDPRTQQLEEQEGKTALFTLCGSAADCAIAGKASNARGLYVRREALELALYALQYTDVDQVVVTLPPDPALPLDRAIYLRRDDLQRELDRPLSATLPSPTPVLGAVDRSPAVTLLGGLPAYAFHVEQGSDLRVIAMLGDLQTAAATALANAATATGTTTTTTPQTTTTTPQTTNKKGKSGGHGG